MRFLSGCALACLLAVPASAARRAKKKPALASAAATAAPQATAPYQPPKPGTCVYIQPSVKSCSAVEDGHGSFDVSAANPAVLFVRTEDPILNFIPPDPRYFQAEKRETSLVIAPIKDRLPELTPTIITTKALTITLRIHRGEPNTADTQLSIHDPFHDVRNEQLTQAVAQAKEQLRKQLGAQLQGERLEDLARSGLELKKPKGHRIARNSTFIVLEATSLVRLGAHHTLLFTVENRSGERFQIRGLRLWIGDRPVEKPAWKCDRSWIASGEQARGALELPMDATGGTLRLAVDEIDPRRSVELAGLEVR